MPEDSPKKRRAPNESLHTPTALDLMCHACPLDDCDMKSPRCLLRAALEIPDDVPGHKAELIILAATRREVA